MQRLGMFAAVVMTLVLGACGTSSPDPSGAGPVDMSGHWQMTSGTIDGVVLALVDDAPITLTVTGTADQRASGLQSVRWRDRRRGWADAVQPDVDDRDGLRRAGHGRRGGVHRGAATGRRMRHVEGDRLTLTGPGVELLFESG